MKYDVQQLNRHALAAVALPTALECAVIIPTLNEHDNIPVMVAALETALAGRAYEVIFVDDWSTDGTPSAVEDVAARYPNVRLIRRFGRRGLSTAVVEGAMATMAPIIAVIDADMQHDEALLPKLIDAITIGDADIAIGSRYVAEGSIGDWDAQRAKGSRLATLLSQNILKTPVSDPMSGFFVVRKAAVIDALPHLSNMGFKILLDVLVSCPAPLKVVELPYQFRNRNAGESKLDSTVAVDFLMMLLDKKFGRIISPRLLMFAAVGGMGLIVHLTVLRAGLAVPGVSFSIAQSAAVLCAIAFNFTLNNVLTYRDRRLRGSALLWGLFSFYAVCGLGAIANVGVGSLVFTSKSSWLVAGVAGAIVGSVWNFAASSFVTWRKR